MAITKRKPRQKQHVRIVKFSGYWGAPNETVREVLTDLMELCEVLLLTEVSSKKRWKLLDSFEGWTCHQDREHGDAAEVAILTKDSVVKVEHYQASVLGPDLGPGGREIGNWTLLRYFKTKGLLQIGDAHLPSATEGNFWTNKRSKVLRDCVEVARQVNLRLRRKFKANAELFFADWNLNLHKIWVQKWIAKAWPGMSLPRPSIRPRVGSHAGRRLIDWFLRRNFRVTKWKVLPKTNASDHSPELIEGYFYV